MYLTRSAYYRQPRFSNVPFLGTGLARPGVSDAGRYAGKMMTTLGKCLLGAALFWTIGHMLVIRAQARSGKTVVVPMVSGTLIFALLLVLTVALGWSPLHFLWMFPISVVAGIGLLTVPLYARLVLYLVVLLALPMGKSNNDSHNHRLRRTRKKPRAAEPLR